MVLLVGNGWNRVCYLYRPSCGRDDHFVISNELNGSSLVERFMMIFACGVPSFQVLLEISYIAKFTGLETREVP